MGNILKRYLAKLTLNQQISFLLVNQVKLLK